MSVVFGLFLFALLAVAALLPSVQTPLIDTFEILPTAKEIAFLAASLMAIVLHVVVKNRCQMPGMARHAVPVVLIFSCYALASILWTTADHACVRAQCLMIVLLTCSIYLPYAFVRMTTVEHVRRAVSWSMLLFTIICVVYTAESFFDLGLRSPEAALIDPMVGIVRVKGPLFASSTGYLLIIPGVAYFSDTSICSIRAIIRYCCIFCLIVTLLATASRGGMICLAIFCILFFTHSMAQSKRFLSVLILFVLIGLGVGYAYTYVSTERFQILEDGRTSLYHTATELIADHDLGPILAGTGIASIWPYGYIDQQIRQGKGLESVTTEAGELSVANGNYHPHSVPLYLIGEYGLAGALLFVAYAWLVIALYRGAVAAGHALIFTCGLVIAVPACFLDLFFFYNQQLGLWWWFWAFSAMALSSRRYDGASAFRRI